MTSPVSAIEAIEKAMEGVTVEPWPAAGLHPDTRYIHAVRPAAMREVLALARQAEALTGIGSAHDLISDWLGEGTDDLPDETPVRVEIGKRAIVIDNLGSLRRARALLGGSENAE